MILRVDLHLHGTKIIPVNKCREKEKSCVSAHACRWFIVEENNHDKTRAMWEASVRGHKLSSGTELGKERIR